MAAGCHLNPRHPLAAIVDEVAVSATDDQIDIHLTYFVNGIGQSVTMLRSTRTVDETIDQLADRACIAFAMLTGTTKN